jgi:hypothetical protein
MALDDEYGKGNVDAIERHLKSSAARSAGPTVDAKEFRPLLTKLAALKPDAIVLTGSLADTALLVKQYGELGLSVPLVGGGGHSSKAFRNIAGSASDGMIVVPAFWHGYFKNKETADFEKGFHAKYTALEGDEWSMFAYDAVMMVAAAMERVKSTEGTKVIPELFKQGPINGAAGSYRITPNGEIETTVFIGTWAPSGKVELIRAWAPRSSTELAQNMYKRGTTSTIHGADIRAFELLPDGTLAKQTDRIFAPCRNRAQRPRRHESGRSISTVGSGGHLPWTSGKKLGRIVHGAPPPQHRLWRRRLENPVLHHCGTTWARST